jgi:hypothetical protein
MLPWIKDAIIAIAVGIGVAGGAAALINWLYTIPSPLP